MIITDILIAEINIPLRTPFITALRRVDNAESLEIRIITNSALIGVSEVPATKAITGEDFESIKESIACYIKPQLLGQSVNTKLLEELHSCCEGRSSAKASIDIALYDLLAQEKNLPLYRYLGGEYQKLETDVTISLNTPEVVLSDAKKALKNGFELLKVKLGDEEDLERLEILSKHLPKTPLILDANQAWSREKTLTLLSQTTHKNILLIEQPVQKNELKALKDITLSSKIDIIADESAFDLKEIKHLVEHQICDLINIKLMKCGGIFKAIEIIKYCQSKNVKCMLGSMLETPQSIAAALHLAMTYSDTIIYLDLDSPLLYENIPPYYNIRFHKNILYLDKINKLGI